MYELNNSFGLMYFTKILLKSMNLEPAGEKKQVTDNELRFSLQIIFTAGIKISQKFQFEAELKKDLNRCLKYMVLP